MLFSGTLMMVLTAVIGMIDILLAATFLGEDAAAGINLVLPIYSMGSFFAVTFSYGVPILYSKYIGAFQKEEADRCFGVGLTVISIIGILLFVLILLGGDAYLQAYQSGSQAYHYARSYLSWMKYVLLLLPYNELLDGMSDRMLLISWGAVFVLNFLAQFILNQFGARRSTQVVQYNMVGIFLAGMLSIAAEILSKRSGHTKG